MRRVAAWVVSALVVSCSPHKELVVVDRGVGRSAEQRVREAAVDGWGTPLGEPTEGPIYGVDPASAVWKRCGFRGTYRFQSPPKGPMVFESRTDNTSTRYVIAGRLVLVGDLVGGARRCGGLGHYARTVVVGAYQRMDGAIAAMGEGSYELPTGRTETVGRIGECEKGGQAKEGCMVPLSFGVEAFKPTAESGDNLVDDR